MLAAAAKQAESAISNTEQSQEVATRLQQQLDQRETTLTKLTNDVSLAEETADRLKEELARQTEECGVLATRLEQAEGMLANAVQCAEECERVKAEVQRVQGERAKDKEQISKLKQLLTELETAAEDELQTEKVDAEQVSSELMARLHSEVALREEVEIKWTAEAAHGRQLQEELARGAVDAEALAEKDALLEELREKDALIEELRAQVSGLAESYEGHMDGMLKAEEQRRVDRKDEASRQWEASKRVADELIKVTEQVEAQNLTLTLIRTLTLIKLTEQVAAQKRQEVTTYEKLDEQHLLLEAAEQRVRELEQQVLEVDSQAKILTLTLTLTNPD